MNHDAPMTTVERFLVRLVYAQKTPLIGGYIWLGLVARGTDIHPLATIGPGLRLQHSGIGVVVHSHTQIGRDVHIFPGVVVGRADIWHQDDEFGGFIIDDHVVLGAGAKLLTGGPEPLRVGRGTIVGANAVLTQSTGDNEIWAGAPARKIDVRVPAV